MNCFLSQVLIQYITHSLFSKQIPVQQVSIEDLIYSLLFKQVTQASLNGSTLSHRDLDVINISRDSLKSSTYQLKYILISSLRTFVLITGDMVSKGSDSKTSRLTVQEIIDESSVIPLQPTYSTSPGINIKHVIFC